jgi:hypothetical protein
LDLSIGSGLSIGDLPYRSPTFTLSDGVTIVVSFHIGSDAYTDSTKITAITKVGNELDITAAGDLMGPLVSPNMSELDLTFSQAGGRFNTITGSGTYSTTFTLIPEPSTWAMMLIGFAGLGYAAFRRRAKRDPAVSAV